MRDLRGPDDDAPSGFVIVFVLVTSIIAAIVLWLYAPSLGALK